jgi:hypothetical protein
VQIKTAHQQLAILQNGGTLETYVRREMQARWPTAEFIIPWNNPRGEVYAQVIRSNWVAVCVVCKTGMFIELGEPFYCVDCGMVLNDGYPMHVIWPDNRAEIERVLIRRARPITRNWQPGETTDMLIAENIEHGEAY